MMNIHPLSSEAENTPLLFSRLTDKMIQYLHTYPSPLSFEKISQYLALDQQLKQYFEKKEEHLIPLEERLSYFVAFTWGLMAKAVEKDEAFEQGLFQFEDPDHRIVEFFRPIAYRRPSSHYRERVQTKGALSWFLNAYAVDDKNFPAGHRTAIFGSIQMPFETRQPTALFCPGENSHYSFLKTETYSGAPWRPVDFLCHTWDYIRSRGRVWNLSFFRSPREKEFREEDPPAEISKKFKQLMQKAPQSHKKMAAQALVQAKEYGVAGIWHASAQFLSEAERKIGTPSGDWFSLYHQTKELKQELEEKYKGDVHIRKGNEVVLQKIFTENNNKERQC